MGSLRAYLSSFRGLFTLIGSVMLSSKDLLSDPLLAYEPMGIWALIHSWWGPCSYLEGPFKGTVGQPIGYIQMVVYHRFFCLFFLSFFFLSFSPLSSFYLRGPPPGLPWALGAPCSVEDVPPYPSLIRTTTVERGQGSVDVGCRTYLG